MCSGGPDAHAHVMRCVSWKNNSGSRICLNELGRHHWLCNGLSPNWCRAIIGANAGILCHLLVENFIYVILQLKVLVSVIPRYTEPCYNGVRPRRVSQSTHKPLRLIHTHRFVTDIGICANLSKLFKLYSWINWCCHGCLPFLWTTLLSPLCAEDKGLQTTRRLTKSTQGTYSVSCKTSYCQISRYLEAARFEFRVMLWNMAGVMGAVLP